MEQIPLTIEHQSRQNHAIIDIGDKFAFDATFRATSCGITITAASSRNQAQSVATHKNHVRQSP
jgi:hypothetical protein